jgi:hypothetical protein
VAGTDTLCVDDDRKVTCDDGSESGEAETESCDEPNQVACADTEAADLALEKSELAANPGVAALSFTGSHAIGDAGRRSSIVRSEQCGIHTPRSGWKL